jgi:RimJ/RimL family protein N-acetyltransferase
VERPAATVADEVVLRPVEDDDLPIFFEHQADPEASRMAAFPSRGRDAFMAHWARIRPDPTTITRTVLVGGRVAGNVVCWEHPGGREIGYWIGREHWGCGVATRALRAFLDEVSVRPLVAHVAWHNGASIRVLEKCGFRRAPTTDPGLPEDDVMVGFELA